MIWFGSWPLSQSNRRHSGQDVFMSRCLGSVAAVAAAVVVVIVAFLLIESAPAFAHVGVTRFFTDRGWQPAARVGEGQFNLLPAIVGTSLAAAGAVVLATPLGILAAVYGRFLAPRFVAGLFRRMMELLAGIPSVVYGLWGLVVLVPMIARIRPPGASLLAGILILALMILPTIGLLVDAALVAVPVGHLQAAAALGLSRWRTVCCVVLPSIRGRLSTAVLLATGRALGETMAVLMVCGNVVRFPSSPFDPVRTLTAGIALEMGYAMGDHRAALFASGLLLMALVAGLVAMADRFGSATQNA